MMITLFLSLFLTSNLFVTDIQAKAMLVGENDFTMQAPQEIIDIFDQAAQLMAFEQDYILVIPKAPSFYIEPFTKMIHWQASPTTKHNIIIVNPEWFMPMDDQERIFISALCFASFAHDPSIVNKVLDWMPLIVPVVTPLIYHGLNQTRAAEYYWLTKLAATMSIAQAIHFATRMASEYLRRYDLATVINTTIEQIGNKDAAIKALEYFNASIKNEFDKGEPFWEPFIDLFSGYIEA